MTDNRINELIALYVLMSIWSIIFAIAMVIDTKRRKERLKTYMNTNEVEVHFFSQDSDIEKCPEVRKYLNKMRKIRPNMTSDRKKVNCHDCQEILIQIHGIDCNKQ